MPIRKWIAPNENSELTNLLSRECSISALAASVLAARGCDNAAKAKAIIEPGHRLASPFSMADMDKAVSRILEGIKNGEGMTVYGDYDCDGITAATILYTYLSSIGAKADYYIPEREGDGYGINKPALQKLYDNGVRLVITVDNGISALEEAEFAYGIGLSLVITDHHQPGELLPKAAAVVNPHRKDDESSLSYLSGAGVAFKLICGLEEGQGRSVSIEKGLAPCIRAALELAAVGTIGDIVPLIGENRIIVREGLGSLSGGMDEKDGNLGLRELAGIAGAALPDLNAQTVAFSLVPRINASGRMGNAALSISLLLCKDVNEAVELSRRLDEINRERQTAETEITLQIEEMLKADPTLLDASVLILAGDSWNHGVLGIVAARMVERHGKPSLVMAMENGVYKGSARSLGDFHLFKALSYCSELLERFGGHKLAAGFSIEPQRLGELRAAMEEYAKSSCAEMPVQTVCIDKRLSARELTVEQVEGLACLEPYGASNPTPVFLIENAEVGEVVRLSGGRHIRLSLKTGGIAVTALWFGMTEERLCCRTGDRVSVVGSLMVNEYQGRRSVSFRIDDLRPSCFNQDEFFKQAELFEAIRKASCSKAESTDCIPTRDELAFVYKHLKANNGFAGDASALYLKLLPTKMSFCKLAVALTALKEVGLTLPDSGGGISLRPLAAGEKVDIFEAPILH